ncbi:MAG: ABC transporter permease [Mariniblastus sp.]|nr:ABC transporter permease [Mariniblastus sp.]
MRPYLAIIKDSFRAALASRVLFVLLFVITLLLVAIAPFHVRETAEWQLNWEWRGPNQGRNNVNDPGKIIDRLVNRQDQADEKPIARIWNLLPKKIQSTLPDLVQGDAGDEVDEEGEEQADEEVDEQDRGPGPSAKTRRRNRQYGEFIDALNEIIEDPSFYREEDWANRPLPTEAEDLMERGLASLSPDRQRRFNRLLLSTALSPEVTQGETALDFYYGFWRVDILSQVYRSHQAFSQTLTSVIPFYFDKFVMSIGLLIAIVVTANMIPDMFEPGSLNLLLSKPIFRWALYLSKFIGGCAFIALCAGYLFFGVWLWMGLALDVWDRGILLSIPLYILVFAIYFSVSAIVGLLYRSPTVSVILTLLFWAFCFGIGFLFNLADARQKSVAISDVVPLADEVMTVGVLQTGSVWNASDATWQAKLEPALKPEEQVGLSIGTMFGTEGFPKPVGPLLNPATNQLLGTRLSMEELRPGRARKMYVADATKMKFVEAGKYPPGVTRLSLAEGRVLAISGEGFYELDQAALDSFLQDQSAQQGSEPSLPGAEDEQPTAVKTAGKPQSFFNRVGPQVAVDVRSKGYVSVNQKNGQIAVYDRGTVTLFKRNEQGYQRYASLDINLDFSDRMSCTIEYQGDTIMLVFGNGLVVTVDADRLVELNEYSPETKSPVNSVQGSPDGRWFAMLYRNRELWILDRQNDAQMNKAKVPGQGTISSVAFGGDDQLWIADRTDRVTRVNLSSGSNEEQLSPAGDWLSKTYRYVLAPFYRVCPKPGEFYKLVTHLSATDGSTQGEDVDLRDMVEQADPWGPLKSGIGFMAIMLFFACLIFQCKDY